MDMVGERLRVVVVDRPSWYEPALEAQELGRANAEVITGWATQEDRPPEADQGYPFGELGRLELSRLTSAYVPPHVTTAPRVVQMARGAAGIMVVRAAITGEVMDALAGLRVIGRYGIGVDNVDVDAATRRGIAVLNTPGFCAREVADHTMMLLLACARKLRMLDGMMHRGAWGRDQASPMPALYRQTLGLVGFGQIAREVALRALAFGLTVVAHDAYVAPEEMTRRGVRPAASLEALLAAADFVSIHAPLTAETRHLMGEAQLRAMKPTAFLINTARGPLIDERALVFALREGWIAGAGLDVFEREPPPAEHPLLALDNVLLTPHVAGLSDEGQETCRRRLAAAMADVLSGGWPAGSELCNPAVKASVAARS
jgi:D-3-phosphoglycerate dehydrogenase